jgi:hypothetical protein
MLAILADNTTQATATPARFGTRVAVWLPLAVLPTAVAILSPVEWPLWLLMTVICAVIYSSFKWISWKTCRRPAASWLHKLAWWLAWPGMDVARFLSQPTDPESLRASAGEGLWALLKTLVGAGLFLVGLACIGNGHEYAGGWCGMVGMVLMVHFGVFHLISCGWRLAEIDAPPIMDRPLSAQTLGEFWGRRWNRAFRDAVYVPLFRPVARRWGPLAAMWAVFLFSGVIHEAAISVPAGAGFGLPTLYFVLQSLAIVFQNSRVGRWLAVDRGPQGHVFTLFVVFAPVAMLFHPPFVYRVILPLMHAVSGG